MLPGVFPLQLYSSVSNRATEASEELTFLFLKLWGIFGEHLHWAAFKTCSQLVHFLLFVAQF